MSILRDLPTHLKDSLPLEEFLAPIVVTTTHKPNVSEGEVLKNAITDHVCTHGHQIDST